MKIIAISDTHNLHESMTSPIPDGDVLVHAGDLTNIGSLFDVISFAKWSRHFPHKHKLIIAGNHDYCFDAKFPKKYNPEAIKILEGAGWTYLHDDLVEVEGTLFYGSPYQPWFHDWAFNLERGKELRKKWALIPQGTEVLITHGPPLDILDKVERGGGRVGCGDLARRIAELPNLKAHIFGHIHEHYGTKKVDGVKYVNASICTLQYRPTNKPWAIEI